MLFTSFPIIVFRLYSRSKYDFKCSPFSTSEVSIRIFNCLHSNHFPKVDVANPSLLPPKDCTSRGINLQYRSTSVLIKQQIWLFYNDNIPNHPDWYNDCSYFSVNYTNSIRGMLYIFIP